MAKLLITGGRHSEDAFHKEAWNRSEAGIILLYDTETGAVESVFEYVTPKELVSDEGVGTTFKCGEVRGGILYVPTEWELLMIDVKRWEIIDKISLPVFNDVHAVTFLGDNFIITSTGLDAVFEITREGDVAREWSVLDSGSIWDRFDRDTDYRKIASTKPHAVHPNFATVIGDDVWVTRFSEKDAICLTDRSKGKVAIDVETPHDGHLIDGKLFYTTVNGHVVVFDADSKVAVNDYDLNSSSSDFRPLGWCRGLAKIERNVFVGFSRLRPTRYTKNVAWLKDIRKSLATSISRPTRVGVYDCSTGFDLVDEVNMEPYGLSVIFSVIPL